MRHGYDGAPPSTPTTIGELKKEIDELASKLDADSWVNAPVEINIGCYTKPVFDFMVTYDGNTCKAMNLSTEIICDLCEFHGECKAECLKEKQLLKESVYLKYRELKESIADNEQKWALHDFIVTLLEAYPDIKLKV